MLLMKTGTRECGSSKFEEETTRLSRLQRMVSQRASEYLSKRSYNKMLEEGEAISWLLSESFNASYLP